MTSPPGNAVWSPASHLNAHDSAQQTAMVPGDLGRVFPTTLEILGGVLHVKNYTFIKWALVTDGKKELLFAEGGGHKV